MQSRNLAQHELIGLEVIVDSANDPTQKGMKGRVVDETRNTLVIEKEAGKSPKIVMKEGSAFIFQAIQGTVTIRGEDIRYRPEDRIKRSR